MVNLGKEREHEKKRGILFDIKFKIIYLLYIQLRKALALHKEILRIN